MFPSLLVCLTSPVTAVRQTVLDVISLITSRSFDKTSAVSLGNIVSESSQEIIADETFIARSEYQMFFFCKKVIVVKLINTVTICILHVRNGHINFTLNEIKISFNIWNYLGLLRICNVFALGITSDFQYSSLHAAVVKRSID